MKKLLLISLVVMTAAIAGCDYLCDKWCVEEEALAPQDRTLLDEARIRAARTDSLHLTVRGEGLAGLGWQHDSEVQARVEPTAARAALDRSETGRVGIQVRLPTGDFSRVSIDSESEDEGRLFRVHVDCPTPPSPVPDRQTQVPGRSDPPRPDADSCNRVLIIGLYDGLWSEKAINDQAYACRECPNGSTVCGSNPRCR